MNREKVEEQLENVVWQDREFGRHKTWLKAAVVEVARKERSFSWREIGSKLVFMSKLKKTALIIVFLLFFGSGLVYSYGKITGRAVAEEFLEYVRGFSFTFKDLPQEKKLSMSEDFWKNLQKQITRSQEAKDLTYIGEQTLQTIHFDKDGITDGRVISQKLKLWEFTYDDSDGNGGVLKMRVTLGYDGQNLPQYFSEMIDSRTRANQKELDTFYQLQNDQYYQMALAAPDVEEVPFHIRETTSEESSKYIEPELNEGANKIEYSAPTKSRSLVYNVRMMGREGPVGMGLNDSESVIKILRFFSKKDGKKIDVWVCKDAIPCRIQANENDFEAAYIKVFMMLPKDILRTIQMKTTHIQSGDGKGGFKMALFDRGTELEYEDGLVTKFPRWFENAEVPEGYKYVLIDKYGLPHDMIEILKKQIPELYVIVDTKK